jgi:hypothetical protein
MFAVGMMSERGICMIYSIVWRQTLQDELETRWNRQYTDCGQALYILDRDGLRALGVQRQEGPFGAYTTIEILHQHGI